MTSFKTLPDSEVWGLTMSSALGIMVFSFLEHRETAESLGWAVTLQGGLGDTEECAVFQTGEGVNDVRKGACANHVSTMAGFLKVRAALSRAS